MRAAIVHYWLLDMRGGEKVVEALCRMLPDADIFTLFYDPDAVSPAIRSHRITSSFLNPLKRFHRHLLPLMPFALEQFDLRSYDLVISSESGPAKGVITGPQTRHICYCHTPMRYLWHLYPEYLKWSGPLTRAALACFAPPLRVWDCATAARVDEFVANSENVRRRIWKAYRRESEVIYPPVAVDRFFWEPSEDYYLIVSELVPYKRLDYTIRYFATTGRRLKVAGDGPQFSALKKLAGPTVEFCGKVSDSEIQTLFSRCRAFLMPGEEDFGITAIESLASGKPVISLGRGGVLESVTDGITGVLYSEPQESYLAEAISRFEAMEGSISPPLLQAQAAKFSEAVFYVAVSALLARSKTSAADGVVQTLHGS
jgi:glycosyltransferase involved in cell wall biosynthesis